MDIGACVEKLVPAFEMEGSATIVDRADYEGRDWIDIRLKPKWADLEAIWPTVEQETAQKPQVDEIALLKARVKALEDAQIARTP